MALTSPIPTQLAPVDYAKTDRATAAIGISDTTFNLVSGTIKVNGVSPTTKVWLALDPTSATVYEPVYATVTGSAVSQMYRPYAVAHPLASGLGCEVRLIESADMINAAQYFQETGWTTVPNFVTLTYASATTFTMSGDWTGILAIGDRLRLTNSTTKYFYVTGLSVASNITTVTVMAGTDYTLASGAISGLYYSKAAAPSAFPAAFNYVPIYSGSGSLTFTGVTTTVGRFNMIGSDVFFRVQASGTTGGTTSTAVRFTLPLTAKDTSNVFSCRVNDGASNNGTATLTSTTVVDVYRNDAANWSLAAGRVIYVNGFYEAV